jgi:hypothetical protein
MTSWAAIVLSSFAPVGAAGLVLPGDAVDWRGTWREFLGGLNAKARIGACLGVLIAMSAPLWTMGQLASLARLSVESRARAMDALLRHRIYAFRELALMLKVCACMALFRSRAIRARTGYDGPRKLPVVLEACA